MKTSPVRCDPQPQENPSIKQSVLDFMDVLSDKGIVVLDYDESMLASELDGMDLLNPS